MHLFLSINLPNTALNKLRSRAENCSLKPNPGSFGEYSYSTEPRSRGEYFKNQARIL
jgi:hypothetical protein